MTADKHSSISPATSGQQRPLALALCGFLLTLCLPVSAFDLTSGQPITVSADSARLDDAEGTAVYTGKVEIRQDRTLMTADKVVLYRNAEGLDRIEAEGNPARYRQPAVEGDGETDASASQIRYSAANSTLILERNAVIEQAGNRFSGDVIHYDTLNRVVNAEGRPGEPDSQGRVEMVIQPRQPGASDSNQ